MTDTATHAPRRSPSQQRARDRVDRILDVALARIATAGSDALRMSDVAADAEISIGSLYQYFPDKGAIIRQLAERYNAEGLACVAAIFAKVTTPADLELALIATLEGYYRMFCAHPAMRDIWSATQADKRLMEIDTADCRAHGDQLAALLLRLAPTSSAPRRRAVTENAHLTMQLIAAAVRHAITLPRDEGDAMIRAMKRLRPWAQLL